MKRGHHAVRVAAFVVAVAAISTLTDLTLEAVSTRHPQLGFSRLVAFTHKGAS